MDLIPPNEPRPDFLLIGAQKAGTTSLFFDLRAQPGVFVPDDKELRILFDADAEKIRSACRQHFERAAPEECRGDCTTGYSKRTEYPGIPERAAKMLGPDLKIIYMLRDPVQRLLSHHHHQCNRGEPLPLDEALIQWPQLLDNSRYGFQLEAWLEFYPSTSIHVVFFEDFKADRADVVRSCCEFLGLTFDPGRVTEKIYNKSSGKPRVDTPIQRVKDWGLYRRLLRPLIPLEARLWLVRRLSPNAPPRTSEIPSDCRERVYPPLIEDGRKLERLLGAVPPWMAGLADNFESPTEGRLG